MTNMHHRNEFKYRCDDCGWTGFFRLNDFARHSRPRCPGCGSYALDPTNPETKDRIREHNTQADASADNAREAMNLTEDHRARRHSVRANPRDYIS